MNKRDTIVVINKVLREKRAENKAMNPYTEQARMLDNMSFMQGMLYVKAVLEDKDPLDTMSDL